MEGRSSCCRKLINCHCRRRNSPDFLVNVVQLSSHSRRKRIFCIFVKMPACLSFLMSNLIDLSTCWLIQWCGLWDVGPTNQQSQRRMYSYKKLLSR